MEKQNILIVDDRAENLTLLERVLADTRARIVRAGDGNEALKATLHHDFAVAVLDVQMPGMDGYELAELLRSDRKTRHMPIIFLTAYEVDEHHIFKGYEAGGVDYLTKPLRPRILQAKVEVFLQLDRQRKELQEKLDLERSKTYLENILMAMSDAVIVINPTGRIQKVNRAGETILGVGETDLLDENIARFFPDSRTRRLFSIQDRQPNDPDPGSRTDRTEHVLQNAQQEKIPVSMSVSAFVDAYGEAGGWVLVASDIRQLKLAEQNRIHLEKMRALGTMTAGMAHELNNPMMGILGFAEYCRQRTPADDKRHGVLSDIERETQRCIDIVQNLLTFSRRERNRPAAVGEIRLAVVLERVIKLLSYRIEKEGVAVSINDESASVSIRADGESLQQVFLNLLVNALDALEGRPDRHIRIRVQARDGRVIVTVADNGCGIDATDQAYIFDPFYTNKPPGKGTGLGLSTALSIVKAQQGTISCSSRKDRGTTFRVELPEAARGEEQ